MNKIDDNIKTDLEMAKQLWEEFGEVPIDDDDCITCEWRSFSKGTNRFDIWHWFEAFFDVSVAKDLMYPDSEENEEQLTKGKLFISSAKCPRCGKPMAVSDLPEYAYQCFDCEEDFYAMECNETSWIYEDDKKKVVPEWLISLRDHGEEWYEKHRDVLDAICKRYAVDHVFFDEAKPDHPYVDFGWIQKPSVATIQGLTDEVMALLELGPKGCN